MGLTVGGCGNIIAWKQCKGMQKWGKGMENIIEIRHLHKSFGAVHAVDDLSFRVKKGELFAFLGVNGAGKSTTIHMLCGQLEKDSGEIVIDGKDHQKEMDAIRASLGVVFQNSVLDRQLSVYDNLKSQD